MGTWGHNINENDTSFDVTETFFEKYNEGMEPAAIKKALLKQFSTSLNDVAEDRDNVLFPLAQCLWETCALDDALLAEVKKNIEHGDNIKTCETLGADDDFLKKRRATLEKFLSKISTPKEKPKPRKKPPARIESKYRAGSCLTFKYPDGTHGGAVAIDADFFNTKGTMTLALTNLRSKTPPAFADFERAKIMDFEWDSVYGQSERYAAIKKDGELHTGRFHQHSLDYKSKQEREAFFKNLDATFCIVGELPKFTQILCNTTWIDKVSETADTFDFYYNQDEPISEMPLKELAKVLTTRAK